MAKSKRAPTLTPASIINWTGVRTQRVEYEPAAVIFAQGNPATSVLYVEMGAVRLSVLSHAGKEAVVAVLDAGHFFGEGCLAGQTQRMATATAMAPSTILAVEKPDMVRQLHAQPGFADRFLTHMLTRNIRIEEDLIDQLFNSTEKRLARTWPICWTICRSPWRSPGRVCRPWSWCRWWETDSSRSCASLISHPARRRKHGIL
jgi:CRP/FNR family cyclic AMP-dependent transcriptional regulator